MAEDTKETSGAENRFKDQIETLRGEKAELKADLKEAHKTIADQAKALKLAEKANKTGNLGAATGTASDGTSVTVLRSVFHKGETLTPEQVVKNQALLDRMVSTNSGVIRKN